MGWLSDLDLSSNAVSAWAANFHATHSLARMTDQHMHDVGLTNDVRRNLLHGMSNEARERQYLKIDAEMIRIGLPTMQRPDPLPDRSEIRENWEATRSQKRRENLENFLASKNGGSEMAKSNTAKKSGAKTATKSAARAASAVRRPRKEHAVPRVGSKFSVTFKGKLYEMTVVKHGDGVGYQIGKKIFNTPNDAETHVVVTGTGNPKRYGSHGWTFWGIESNK